MSDEREQTVDDARVLRWERAALGRWGAYLTEAERRGLDVALSVAEPTRALDVGCGSGRWSLIVRDAGWRVTCADVDVEALELCRRRMPDVTCIEMGDQDEKLPADSDSLGLLVVIEVPPVVEQSWFAQEAARVLSAGGVIVSTYHNSRSLRGLAHRVLRRRQERFYAGPPFDEFKRRLNESGFEILHTEGLAWFPFKRESDSRLIPIFTGLERVLGLRRLTMFSPFLVLVARLTRPGLPSAVAPAERPSEVA